MDKTDNRELILDTALDLFSRKGYDLVGVQSVVEGCNLTKPTLYHYFTNKPGLLKALLARELSGLQEQFKRASDYHGDLPETLKKTAALMLDYFRDRKTTARLVLALRHSPAESDSAAAVTPHFRQLYNLTEKMFAAAAEDHGNMRGRQKSYAFSFLGTIFVYIGLYLDGSIDLNDDTAFRLVHQFSHGIYS